MATVSNILLKHVNKGLIYKQCKDILTLSNHYSKRFSKALYFQQIKCISTSPCTYLKEIRYTEDENKIVIEGVKIKSPRAENVINVPDERGACPLCRLGLKFLSHTDVLILSQFISSDGTVQPQQATGLCDKQHYKVRALVRLAQRAGLLPQKPDVPIFGDWEKHKTYFHSR